MLNTYLETAKKLAANTTVRIVIAIFLLTVIFYYPTWTSLVSIWTRSETFAHGYIVIPVSLWLIWQNKAIHPYLFPGKPSGWGLLFLLANGFLWLLASLINVLVIQQYALVGILIGAIWFYLGNETSKKLIFPLAFLYFMVPVGEALIPHLIDFTADFTIYLLRKTGLSVYREGTHFSLVSGDWSVVEACSGLRYLLASFTLGTIYAYITYQKPYKRLLFMLFSLVLPIIANGLRAYMIVMIGHLSGMKLAVGVDHLVYGAVFFALIIFLMFYIGSFFRDPPAKQSATTPNNVATNSHSFKHQGFLFLTLVVCVSIWPLSNTLIQAKYHVETNTPDLSLNNSSWQEIRLPIQKQWGWTPGFKGAVTESLRYYQNQKNIIGFYQANFGNEKQGAELVNSQNKLIPDHLQKEWRIVKQSNLPIPQLGSSVDAIVLKNRQENRILLFKWYQVGNQATNNPYLAKIFQLIKKVTFDTSPETYNILFTYSSTLNASKDADLLKKFLIETEETKQ